MNRHTLKAGRERIREKQRGGAVWSPVDAARQADWQPHLERLGITALFDAAATPKQKIDAFVTAVASQDDLFDAVLDIMRGKVGVPDDLEEKALEEYIIANAATIDTDANMALMKTYIQDIEKILYFAPDKYQAKNPTKIQYIINVGRAVEPLSSLFLYPERMANIFIFNLARIIVSLKNDETLTKIAGKDTLINLYASKMEGYSQETAWSLTAKELRDGFYVSNGLEDFKRWKSSFWLTLVANLSSGKMIDSIKDVEYGDYGRGLADTTTWLYQLYIKNGSKLSLSVLLNALKTDIPANFALPEFSPIFKTIPDATYHNDPILDSETTYKMLASQMDDKVFQYLFHLTHTIEKLTEKEEQEMPS